MEPEEHREDSAEATEPVDGAVDKTVDADRAMEAGGDGDENMDDMEEDELPEFIDLEDPNFEVVADFAGDEPFSDDDDDDDDDAPEAGDLHDEEGQGDGEMEEYRDDALAVFTGHKDPVHALCLLPGAPFVVTGGEDDTALVWKYPECTTKHTLTGHTDTVIAAACTFDGKLIATGGLDAMVKLWDAETGALHGTLEGLSEGVEWIVCHPKGGVVFAGAGDGQTMMWNLKGECMQVFAGHSDRVSCGLLSLDGRQLVTGSADCTIRVWNPKTAETTNFFDRLTRLPDSEVLCLHFTAHTPDVLLSGHEDGSVAWLGLKNGKVLKTQQGHTGSVEHIDSCPTAPLFASASTDGTVIVWNITTQDVRNKTTWPTAVIRLQWKETKLYAAIADGSIRVKDGRSGAEDSIKVWKGHEGPIHNFALTPCGQYIVSASDDDTCRVFPL